VGGAVEPPIVGRYSGSLIEQQSVRAFDRATSMTKLNAQRKHEGIAVEGRAIHRRVEAVERIDRPG